MSLNVRIAHFDRYSDRYIGGKKPPNWQLNLFAVAFAVVVIGYVLAGWSFIAARSIARTVRKAGR